MRFMGFPSFFSVSNITAQKMGKRRREQTLCERGELPESL